MHNWQKRWEVLHRELSPEKASQTFINEFKEAGEIGSDLSGMNLSGLVLDNLHLFKVNLSGSDLTCASLVGCDLTAADLTNATLSEANLTDVGLGQAVLCNANFFSANLTNATLTGADLTGADLRCAQLKEARIREAKLVSADCTSAQFLSSNMSLTDVTGAIFNEADFRNCRMRRLKGYEKAQWIGCDIRDINFAGAYRIRRHIVDENYIYEFKNSSRLHLFIYYLWFVTSDCGRSMERWLIMIVLKIAIFARIYSLIPVDYGKYEDWVSPLYYSISTMTTLGYGDVVPASGLTQMVASVQVILGYIMLGGLLSILTNKIARRAD